MTEFKISLSPHGGPQEKMLAAEYKAVAMAPELTDDDMPILDLAPYLELLSRPVAFHDLSERAQQDDSDHGRALTAAVYRAVDELEGQGARSDRIALQLLEALARYELALCEAV